MILKLEAITKDREMLMEKLWKEFQNVLNSYLKYTEEYREGERENLNKAVSRLLKLILNLLFSRVH